MKNSWLLKLSILATVLATLTGCPALSNLMELIVREQAKPKKTLTITGIPPEYEGSSMMVTATDSTDTLGERPCLSGGDPSGRIVKDNVGKTLILEMNAKKMDTKISALVTLGKNLTGIAKSCDNAERIVIFILFPPDSFEEENQDANVLMEKVMNNTFVYTNGINICNASADVLSKTKLTLRFSEMDTPLRFDQFMRASDCEILMDVVRSASNESEEYIVIKEDALIVRDTSALVGKEKAKFAPGEIINVVSPKKTKETDDGYSWIEVFYKDNGVNKKGWVTEKTLPGTAKAVPTAAATSGNVNFVSDHGTSNASKKLVTQFDPSVSTTSNTTNTDKRFIAKEYIVIKEKGLDIMKTPNGDKIRKVNRGEIVRIDPTGQRNQGGNGVFSWVTAYNDEKELGFIIQKEYIAMTAQIVVEEYIVPKDGLKWEEYFVITPSTNLNIRSTPNADIDCNTTGNNCIAKIKQGSMIKVALGTIIDVVQGKKIEKVSPQRIKDFLWAKIHYKDDNNEYNHGWVAIEKYIAENSSVIEYINIFSTSNKKRLEFIKNLKIEFIENVEGGQQTEGYLVGNEKDGIVSSIVEESGLTIATGFDIGKRNESNIDRIFGIWTKEENPETYTLINLYKSSPYLGSRLGLEKTEADLKLMNLWNNEKKRLKISKEQAILTDHAAMFIHLIDIMSKYNTFTKGNFDELPAEAQTVLFSLSYQYGLFSEKYNSIMENISKRNKINYGIAADLIEGLDPDGKNYGDRRPKEANLLREIK